MKTHRKKLDSFVALGELGRGTLVLFLSFRLRAWVLAWDVDIDIDMSLKLGVELWPRDVIECSLGPMTLVPAYLIRLGLEAVCLPG